MNNSARATGRGRWQFLLLLLVFAAPLGLAFWLYYGSAWRPAARSNHGTLIQPARALPDARVLAGKWSLVVIGSGEGGCDSACRETLIFARQTWLSLGKYASRAQRILVSGSDCCDETYLQREHPGLVRILATTPGAQALRQAFPAPQPRTIFIVDPLGNLMMRYDAQADPKGLREDLKKLLDLSHIG
jgi:hypothetical protein